MWSIEVTYEYDGDGKWINMCWQIIYVAISICRYNILARNNYKYKYNYFIILLSRNWNWIVSFKRTTDYSDFSP